MARSTGKGKREIMGDAKGLGSGLKVAAYHPSKSVVIDAAFCLPCSLSLLL
jgi:hypothetical protein